VNFVCFPYLFWITIINILVWPDPGPPEHHAIHSKILQGGKGVILTKIKNKVVFCLLGGLLLTILGFSTAFAQGDKEGSADHRLLTRMPGYRIDSYEKKEFDVFDKFVDYPYRRLSRQVLCARNFRGYALVIPPRTGGESIMGIGVGPSQLIDIM
jgi:hypothetical protein